MLVSLHKKLHLYLTTIAFALPHAYVSAALPPSLSSTIPTCVQSCLEAQLQKNFAACPDPNDVDCLCSRYGVDGYTVGEDAYACLYSSDCSQAAKSNGTGLYSICSGRTNAVTATHRTIIVTATPTAGSTSSSGTTVPTVATTTDSSTGNTTPPSLDMPSESPSQGVMTMGNISLTMAQIAGITIAAAAVLILSVGIATCLIFVKRNKRLHDMEDSKILLYPSPRPPGSQGSQFALAQPAKDPRGGIGGVGIIPLQRPPPPPPQPPFQQQQQQQQQYLQQQQYSQQQQQQQQQWPRYYPIMPDEIGVATSANYPLPGASRGSAVPVPASSGATMPNPSYVPPPLERQSTGVILPQQPAPVHTEPPSQSLAVPSSTRNSKEGSERNSKRNSKRSSERNSIKNRELRPTSAMTEFEEDSMSPFRANFGKIKPIQYPFAGPQEINPIPYFPAPPQTKPRPPALSIVIPTFETTLPPPPPGPPPSQPPPPLRPPMQREPPAQQLSAPTSHQDLRSSSHSSAVASSQALRSETTVGASSSNKSRVPSKSGRDSQASFTSFESFESDDDPTPPKEEEKRLSPVQESQSPASRIKYPKVPRGANQVVARSPSKQIHVSPEPSPGIATSTPPKANASSSAPTVAHGIGNRLWKTEKSPQSKRPYPNWMDRQEEHWSWASEQSFIAPKTPSRHQTPVQKGYETTPERSKASTPRTPRTPGASTPAVATPVGPEPQWVMQTPQNMSIGMPSPFSPFGPMPKLTPTRRGDELYLSVN